MATGRLPFGGKTTIATALAILQEAPPQLPAKVSSGIRAVVQRCLARSPGERYQHAREVRAALDVALDSHWSIAAQARPPRRRRVVGLAAAAAVVLALAWALWRARSAEPELLVSEQHPIGAFGTAYRQATFSPDGGFIAFADAGTPVPQIWIKNLAQGEPVRITSSDVAASHPTWSPKNDQIVFAERGRGLWSVPPLGGTARLLLDFGAAPRFSADGERLVFTKAGREIWTIRADGTDARRLDGIPMPWYPGALDPAFSRDGTSIVYFFPELGPNGNLWIVPSSGGTPRQLTHRSHRSRRADLDLGRRLHHLQLDAWRQQGPVAGTPRRKRAGTPDRGRGRGPRAGADTRRAHARLYQCSKPIGPSCARRCHACRSRDRQRRRQTLFPRVSPDGTKILFFGFGDVGDVQIFVAPTSGGAVQQLTQGKGQINTMPRWSPDGSLVFYYEQRPNATVRSIPVGGGPSREVRPWQWESHTGAELSPDGALIAYLRQAAPGEPQIAEQTLIEDLRSGKQHALAVTIAPGTLVSDGRSVVGETVDGHEVTTCPADGTPCRRLTRGGRPVWSPDGTQIYFLRDTENAALKELWAISRDGQNARKVFDGVGPFRAIDVAFDLSAAGEVVWGEYVEGRPELWQAILRQ